tara:strand:- start:3674 stop:4009 length:336 start_codon:yes stop_codon:yes gene_type:complete
MNGVHLIGRLTRDTELRYTKNGKAVSSFGLAINEKYKSGDEWKTDVAYVEIVTWEKLAEACAEHLKKGSLVGISGKLKYESWETDDGGKRNKLEVVAIKVAFLDKKESSDE